VKREHALCCCSDGKCAYGAVCLADAPAWHVTLQLDVAAATHTSQPDRCKAAPAPPNTQSEDLTIHAAASVVNNSEPSAIGLMPLQLGRVHVDGTTQSLQQHRLNQPLASSNKPCSVSHLKQRRCVLHTHVCAQPPFNPSIHTLCNTTLHTCFCGGALKPEGQHSTLTNQAAELKLRFCQPHTACGKDLEPGTNTNVF
jgi:hypothetical protein